MKMIEPATEAVMAEVPRAGVDDVDAAVARAVAAYPRWRALTATDRASLMYDLAEALSTHRDELALLEARNAGKPIADARGEMDMVVSSFRYYAGAPERLLGETIPVAGGLALTVREPVGVVGLIVPWNFPLVIASWKLAPALAAGNTVVLKPRRADAADRAAVRGDCRRGRHSRRRRQRGRRPRERVRTAPGRAPGRGQDRVHGLDRDRPGNCRPRRGHDQAGHARVGWKVSE